jgi:hypothetical protein
MITPETGGVVPGAAVNSADAPVPVIEIPVVGGVIAHVIAGRVAPDGALAVNVTLPPIVILVFPGEIANCPTAHTERIGTRIATHRNNRAKQTRASVRPIENALMVRPTIPTVCEDVMHLGTITAARFLHCFPNFFSLR